MIVGISKHGRGGANRALGYLLAERSATRPLAYLLGDNNRAGAKRTPAPVVLRGDPDIARRLIDTSPHRWKYTSGVLSFSAGEQITPEMERKLMDEFEAVAFAGLSPDRYHIVWIRHAHLGREELHFLTPRLELVTGKSLNIAPPGRASRQLFDTWRSKINSHYGLSDPDDPARRRATSLPSHIAKLKDKPRQTRAAYSAQVRQTLTRFIESKVRDGIAKNRADVIRLLQQSGFTIPRRGQDYITVQLATTGERFRLRGRYYEDTLFRENKIPSPSISQPDPKRAAEFARRLEPLRQARAQYHLQRYSEKPSQLHRSLSYDRTGNPPACRIEKVRASISSPRRGVCQQAEALDRATRKLECASNRFGQAHRTFARDYESLVKGCVRRRRVKTLLRQYTVALNSSPGGEEIELERELER